MDDVWNESNNEKVPDKIQGKHHNGLPTDDDRSLSVSNIFSKSLKNKTPKIRR